ncbi:MAG: class I SAM-dependent methyltransferase [Christensenellaceae bacterium]|jgi:23S rRNA (cytosine1962-C5)-methyltransferase|nr:class I SAM-dependent methyltransferase [Christensenellaceae bacterium]
MLKPSLNWHDFEVIASGGGEKIERWGDIILSRPDPQCIWELKNSNIEIHGRYRRSDTGGGFWEWQKPVPAEWQIGYKDMKFIISPMNFKHTGLFPEQAVNWDKIQSVILTRKQSVPKVLNLFAYTGAATVAAASAGAKVTHVDASRGMTDVAKRNVELNGLNARYIVDDVSKFVEREIRRGNLYDAIILDPPNFGRGASGEIWKLESDLNKLILNCIKLLSANPLFILLNNYTASVFLPSIQNIFIKGLRESQLKYKIEYYDIGLPTSEGLILPCGGSVFVSFIPK